MKKSFQKGKKPVFLPGLILLGLFLSVFPIYSQALGDVNNDGKITIIDSLQIAQRIVGFNVPGFNSAVADVDGDGGIKIIDALMIAQYAVGLIDSFPGENPTPTPTGGPTGTEPVASFTISNLVPAVNQSVTFNASTSHDPDGTIVSYEWDFDDDSTATGSQVTHIFRDMDDYKVKLTVTDNNGNTADIKQRVFVGRPQGWTELSHHKSTDGQYDILFPENKVQRMDISIDPADFQRMERNLNTLSMMSSEEPIYVPATLQFNGLTWWHVGIRYKGQSTLFMPRQAGNRKLPLRLHMDKFEDDYPEIKDQRLYGFKKMAFANNWYDATFIKDKICGEIFREGGIPTARTTFCAVYVDTGSGPVYWGLYTMTEDPSDEMLKSQFDDNDGNLYKPEGTGAEFSRFVQSAYVKKTNEDDGDYSDIQALVNALNAPRNNAAVWRSNLESVFNVQEFVRWLAINTSVVNFDTYGWITKNYYLYQDLADNGRLVWIPWDFNLSFNLPQNDPMFSFIPTLSLSLNEVNNQWPLIRYLMDDPVYNELYHQEMENALNGCFNKNTILAKISQYSSLIRSYVTQESPAYSYLRNSNEFDQALSAFRNHINSRPDIVRSYLNSH